MQQESLDPKNQSEGDTKEGLYIGREVPAESAVGFHHRARPLTFIRAAATLQHLHMPCKTINVKLGPCTAGPHAGSKPVAFAGTAAGLPASYHRVL